MTQQEIYNFRLIARRDTSMKDVKEFLSGKQYTVDDVNLAMQYVLLNLRNINLTFISNEESVNMMREELEVRKLPAFLATLPEFGVMGIILGAFDTVLGAAQIVTPERVHYSPPIQIVEFVIMTVVKQSSSANDGGKQFSLGGMQASVWITTTVCLLFLSLVSRAFKSFIRATVDKRRFHFLEYIWFYVSVLLENPPDIFPRRLSVKFLLSGWLLATIVLVRAYTGNLKSEMMVSKTVRVNTLEDLKHHPGMKPAIADLQVFSHNLKQMRKYSAELNQLAEDAYYYKGLLSKLFGSFSNGTEKYAIVDSLDMLKKAIPINEPVKNYLKKKSKSLYFGNKSYWTIYAAFSFNKKIPKRILEDIDYLTLRYVETGQSRRSIVRRDFLLKPFLAKESGTEVNDVAAKTVDELSITFYAWTYGISLSSLTLLLEMLVYQMGRYLM